MHGTRSTCEASGMPGASVNRLTATNGTEHNARRVSVRLFAVIQRQNGRKNVSGNVPGKRSNGVTVYEQTTVVQRKACPATTHHHNEISNGTAAGDTTQQSNEQTLGAGTNSAAATSG